MKGGLLISERQCWLLEIEGANFFMDDSFLNNLTTPRGRYLFSLCRLGEGGKCRREHVIRYLYSHNQAAFFILTDWDKR